MIKTRALCDVCYPFACLDQYTRVTLNVVFWNPDSKWPDELEGQGQWPPNYANPIHGVATVCHRVR